MLNLSENIVQYNTIKRMKMIEVMDYLDVNEKKERVEKMRERIDAENKWTQDFNQKPPKNIL